MISFTTPSVILRSRDVGAYDRLYTVYTRDRGKLAVRAVSIRKQTSKLLGSMNPHAVLTLYVIAQRRFTLGGAVIVENFDLLNASLISQWALQHIRELIDVLTQVEFHDTKLFDIIRGGYQSLAEYKGNMSRTIAYVTTFDMHVLSQLGLLPNLATADGKKEFLKNIPPSLLKHAEQLLKMLDISSNGLHITISLRHALELYGFMRSFMLAHDIEELSTDALLKDLVSNKILR